MSRTLFVIPCGAAKLSRPSPARTLYTGSMFQYCLTVVEEEAELSGTAGRSAAVRILSARHGLLDLDTHVEPYDRRMTDRDAVPTTVVADQLMPLAEAGDTDIHTFLPRPYLARLLAAHEMIEQRGHSIRVHDHYLGTRGIGYQRQVLATLRSTRGTDDSRAPWRRPVSDGQAEPGARSGSDG
ncbi:hypothetical protein BN6_20820 [Saccharothrix espanaensis DSM 44229]|uniref:DUF6884 domain-containing protein n=1 Tax=Saccharothrix espanaensis (strain ATCC 51144 / DSM 44229 / JCM 9112 / NBRC 15066 / NRRL 15764) TaxID=1179773 RepID=K0JV64_SACES|nr:hypothetical protein BN6_20820 [Saccharothrix espanaensis DSM 44229]